MKPHSCHASRQVFDVLEKFLNGLLEEIDLVTCSSKSLSACGQWPSFLGASFAR